MAAHSSILAWRVPWTEEPGGLQSIESQRVRHDCSNGARVRTRIGGFPDGSSSEEPTCQCRRHKIYRFDPWVGKIPWKRERLPTPVFWPGEFHGLYSSWGHKELDTTEQLSLTSITILNGKNRNPHV